MYYQYDLEHESSPVQATILTCWLDGRRLGVGQQLTLRGDDRRWTVLRAGVHALDAPPNQRWKVGGLT